jgi:cyanate lyase
MPPTDPLIYRFYEMVMVNGPAWKALIEEEFGDGIMSAIDFDFDFERDAAREGRPREDQRCPASSCPTNTTATSRAFPSTGYKEE